MTLADKPGTVTRWLEHLESLHAADIELGLERVRKVALSLDCLRPAPFVVLIAGTNGKGTTTAWLSALLQRQGLRVGCYNSPHIQRYNERVSVNGVDITDADLCRSFALVEEARGDTPLTYFEFGTLAALSWLKTQPLDVCILEIGLGGRLDAVNIAEADLCIVTSVGLDHQSWLGDSREAIAGEKYAIARQGVCLVSGEPEPPANARQVVAERGGIWVGRGEQFDVQEDTAASVCHVSFRPEVASDITMHWQLPLGAIPTPNIATGLQALALMDHLLPEQSVARTLDKLSVRGRMQSWESVTEGSDEPLTVTLDVAHNPQAATYLAQRMGRVDGIVLAMLEDKSPADVLRALPKRNRVIAAGLSCARGLSAIELEEHLQQGMTEPFEVLQADTVSDGIQLVQSIATAGEHWLIVGSFFTVEAALNVIEADHSEWKSI